MHALMTSSAVFFIFLLLTLLLTTSSKDPTPIKKDTDSLLAFIRNPNIKLGNPKYNWNETQSTCDWAGVMCDPTNSSVMYLRIPSASLLGKIPADSLGKITSLKVLSLRGNGLSGPLPADFANLIHLTHVFLLNNKFSGPFPSGLVDQWRELIKLDLSNNNFSGSLPKNLPPKLKLTKFNVSNNNLSGKIPSSLANLPKGAISGNNHLCGKPLTNRCNGTEPEAPSPSPSPSPSKNKKKLSSGEIVAIAIGSALILLILLICLGKWGNRAMKEKKAKATMADPAKAGTGSGVGGELGTSSSKDDITGEGNKLVFFEGGVYSFNLEDLLRASTELLGEGSVGTSFKTVLKEEITVVVKRLKDVKVSKEEFDGVMEGLGKMNNENVVPIRAYYYSKGEKFLVCAYFPAGSLSALLHGSRGSGQSPLDWDHRFRIALSAAKGVAYLHVVGGVVHGNIKSSNILLRQDLKKDASVSDFGLNKIFKGSSSPNTRFTGYHAPEVLDTRKVTFKSDVYSFGVLLLELLTGKAPNRTSLGGEGINLPRWVQSVEREKWTTEVFDVELIRYQNIEEEMVQLLKIAMACVLIEPDQRPAMQKVVRMIEDMNRAETDDRMR